MSRAPSEIVPALGFTKPDNRLKKVVLPAPFGPMMAWIVPASMESETSSTARYPAKDFDSPCVATIACADAPSGLRPLRPSRGSR